MKAVARQRLAAGQGELELQLPRSPANGEPALPITSSRMGHLLDALARSYDVLGFAGATGQDEVLRALVLVRIIEPTSKLDGLCVLEEAGMGWVRGAGRVGVRRRDRAGGGDHADEGLVPGLRRADSVAPPAS
jgi:hypothetical protein